MPIESTLHKHNMSSCLAIDTISRLVPAGTVRTSGAVKSGSSRSDPDTDCPFS